MAHVDVRDVALAHVRALKVDTEGRKRVQEFMLSTREENGRSWTDVTRFVQGEYPSLSAKLKGQFPPSPTTGRRRAEDILGIKFEKMEDTVSYFLDHQLELKAQV